MITILRTILGRIGGWLMLAVGALAFLKYRDVRAKSEGRAEERQALETRNAQAMADAVEISSRGRTEAERAAGRRRHTRVE